MCANNGKRKQSIDSVKTYVYGTRQGLVCKKEKIKSSNIIKQNKND